MTYFGVAFLTSRRQLQWSGRRQLLNSILQHTILGEEVEYRNKITEGVYVVVVCFPGLGPSWCDRADVFLTATVPRDCLMTVSGQQLGFRVQVKNGTINSPAALACQTGEYTALFFIPALSLLMNEEAAVRIPSMAGRERF